MKFLNSKESFECVGRSETIRAAWSATRRGGRATVVGIGARTDEVSLTAFEIAQSARTLAGCFYGNADPAAEVPRLLEDYRAGRLDLAALVTDRIPLDEVGTALSRLGAGARAVVVFPDP